MGVLKIAAIGLLLSSAVSGCTYYMANQIAASNVPLDPPGYDVVGPASGEACRNMVFYVIPTGGTNRLQAAIDNALEKSQGDALIEVTTDYKVFIFYPFLFKNCTLVNGLAIKRHMPATGRRNPIAPSLKTPANKDDVENKMLEEMKK